MAKRWWAAGMAALVAMVGGPVEAQALAPAAGYLPDSASPFGPVTLPDADRAAIAMPKLAFTPTPEDEKNYDKYYIFHRDGTDVATAYADISECDGYARGLQGGVAYQQTPYPYAGTIGGAVGSAIGNALAMAIFGSAEKRRLRRVNMRTCMNFKGYGRFGVSKDVWKDFNFEEGLSSVKDEDRTRMLRQQALVASAYRPAGKELGL